MAQTTEAKEFLRRLDGLPNHHGVDLGPAIRPALDDEAALRRLFATDRTNKRLQDPLVGLVDIFGEGTERVKKTHERLIHTPEDLEKRYVMPLSEKTRRKDGTPSMVPDIDTFKTQWSIFTEGALSQLTDWSNVFAAGGSVLACLAPLPESVVKQGSKRAIRKYYHREAYPSSDVDLFIYGLAPEEAEAKIKDIYACVRDSLPWETVAVRSKNTVSIHCQYPYRPVQIVLRLYHSPAEILAGFDVDSSSVGYDGKTIYATPRAAVALMTQSNQVAMDRRSPSYEVRLAKYADRGFEVHVPDLRRGDFDPTIFERALTRVEGLARLLVLEKLNTQEARDGYLSKRREMRGRPNAIAKVYGHQDRRLRNDLKVDFGGLPLSDYDILFHIPYGPGIVARRLEKMIYKTDLGLNSTFNPKNKDRRLHRHPAFFGTMDEVLEDCCQHCPAPHTDEEKALFAKESEQFITGRIAFIEENPGRQTMTGSFRPIDTGEWSEQAYIKPLTKLYTLIASHNRPAVRDFLKRHADATNTRDPLGRTPLQFALLCSATDICLDLIEMGGRMSARLVDGRSTLHLAAQMDLPLVVKALLEKSEKNKLEVEQKAKEAAGGDVKMNNAASEEIRDSSEDDWSEDHQDSEEEYKEAKRVISPQTEPQAEESDALEDPNEPDILEIDAPDWDMALTPLSHAIISGSLANVQLLVAAGADCKTPRKLQESSWSSYTFYPLTLTALTADEAIGSAIAEHLVKVGKAESAAADSQAITVFHRLVALNKAQIIQTLLRVDPSSKVACRFMTLSGWQTNATHPIVTAVAQGSRKMVTTLMGLAGSRMLISQEEYDRSVNANPDTRAQAGTEAYNNNTIQPLEASIMSHNELYRLVILLEPESIKNAVFKDFHSRRQQPSYRRSSLDLAENIVQDLRTRLKDDKDALNTLTSTPGLQSILDLSQAEISTKSGWEASSIKLVKECQEIQAKANQEAAELVREQREQQKAQDRREMERTLKYMETVVADLRQAGARSWNEIFPDEPSEASGLFKAVPDPIRPQEATKTTSAPQRNRKYVLMSASYYRTQQAGDHLFPLYDELFEAVWDGNNNKIKAMCLPAEEATSGRAKDLQITVTCQLRTGSNSFSSGYSPLFVALAARRWDTAKVILEIAGAQLRKPESEVAEVPARRQRIVFEDENEEDEDDREDGSDAESENSVETQKNIGISTIAKRYTTISIDVPPEKLLAERAQVVHDGQVYSLDPLEVAIIRKDPEEFDFVYQLMSSLAEPVSLTTSHLEAIISRDSPQTLTEFIRHTGLGLSFPVKAKQLGRESGANDEENDEDEDERKFYQGLNIHGKKRKDLAARGDKHAPGNQQTRDDPILWKAAKAGSTAIIEHLSTPSVRNAYRQYVDTHQTKLSKRIGAVVSDPKKLGALLGFAVHPTQGSAVLAAVMSFTRQSCLPVLQALMAASPSTTLEGIRLRTSLEGVTPLFALCGTNGAPDAFDWLVEHGADVETRDNQGKNIYHVLVAYSDKDQTLLKHVLGKLPGDTTRKLLSQRTRIRKSTPLAIAVRQGKLEILRTLLGAKDAVAPSFEIRDSNGATPLHAAILAGFSPIVSLLVDAGPPEVLYYENGVGSTALELASMAAVRARLRIGGTTPVQVTGFSAYSSSGYSVSPVPGMRPEDEEDLKSAHSIIDTLRSSGTSVRNPELLDALIVWVQNCEDQLREWKVSDPTERGDIVLPATTTTTVSSDPIATFDVFSRSVVTVHSRSLVHLSDIQQTVLDTVELQVQLNPRAGQIALPDEIGGYDEQKESVSSGCRLLWTYGFADQRPENAL